MKKIAILLTIALCLTAVSCNKANDDLAEKLMLEQAEISLKIATIVKRDPSMTGVDQAIAYFDEHKANYFTLVNKVNKIKPDGLSPDVKKRLDESTEKAYERVYTRIPALKIVPTWDESAQAKYAELLADFKGIGKTDITQYQ